MAKRKEAAKKSGKTLKVTLGLGLRRINHTVELEDTPAVRGMINKVNYLVKLEA